MIRPNMAENPENNPPKAFTLKTNRGTNKTSASTAFNTTNTISKINESMTNAITRRVHRFWSALLARTTSNLRCIMSLHSYTRELKSIFVDAAPCDLSRSGHAVYCGPQTRAQCSSKVHAFTAVAFAQ